MKARPLSDRVQLIGAVDWTRTLFDSLIPLPHGTTYNAYLVRGSQKTVLVDTVDTTKTDVLLDQLKDVPAIDYVVAHHAEQDHSGSLPVVLQKYPNAKLLTSSKGQSMLLDLLDFPAERIQVVNDGETISLGDRTLEFIYTPWVHWPETMVSYLQEEKILFSCDFFGSHLAASETYAENEVVVLPAAKRYYAEIMMPYRAAIAKNLEKLAPYEIRMIAPSHGPVYNRPALIMDAYREWVSAPPRNQVTIPYVSMHHSTEMLVNRLVSRLVEKGVKVHLFDMTSTDIGELAMALVDTATVVIGTPVVLGGMHPAAAYAAMLAGALKPKALYAAFLVSYGWGPAAVERFPEMVGGLKVELLPNVLSKGMPRQPEFDAVDALAETIAAKHAAQNLK